MVALSRPEHDLFPEFDSGGGGPGGGPEGGEEEAEEDVGEARGGGVLPEEEVRTSSYGDHDGGSGGVDDEEPEVSDDDDTPSGMRMMMMTSGNGAPSPDHALPLACNLERFAESDNIFNRQMVAKSLLDTLRSVLDVEDDVTTVLSVLLRLSEDIEPSVRAELVEQVPHIAAFCKDHVARGLDDVLPRYLLPLVMRYLTDPNNQVRKTSQAALLSLLEQKLLKQEEVQEQVCPVVLQLADLENLDHYRTEAVMLMSRMATLLGKELTHALFLDRFVALCSDDLFQVRKVCAIHFGDLCSVMETEIAETVLLPRFLTLCADGMWGVRKACADVFLSVACVCTLAIRRLHLADAFVPLLSDQSRWVRVAAYQALGPFISTFVEPYGRRLCYDQEGNVSVAVNPEDEDDDDQDSEQDVVGYPRGGSDAREDTVTTTTGRSDADLTLLGSDSGFGSRETSTVGSPSEEATQAENERGEQELEEWMTTTAATATTGHAALKVIGIGGSALAHVEDSDVLQDCFNSFAYWRYPIPDVQLVEEDVQAGGRPAARALPACDALRSEAAAPDRVSQRAIEDGGAAAVIHQMVRAPPVMVVKEGEVTTAISSSFVRASSQYSQSPSIRVVAAARQALLSSQAIIPADLLDHYVRMTDPSHLQTMDNEVVRFCAHSLPAVAFTLGRKYWPLLRHLYETLASDMQWKVRRTLAFSIHELAAILGQRLAASDLVPIFNSFVRDLDEVRIGILRHLARFLSFLPLSERISFLPRIQDFLEPENERNWRFRLELAEQLSLLSPLYGGRDVASHLVPVSIRLLQDRVAEVRTAAADTLAQLAQRLCTGGNNSGGVPPPLPRPPWATPPPSGPRLGPPWGSGGGQALLVPLAKDLVSCFARHSQWHQRQTYANVCRHLKCTCPPHVFLAHLLPALLELSSDPVANVRLAVAKALGNLILPPPPDSRRHFLSEPSCQGSGQPPGVSPFSVHVDGQAPRDDDEEFGEEEGKEPDVTSGKRSSVLRVLERLRHDRDRDVRQAATLAAALPLSEVLGPPPSWTSAATMTTTTVDHVSSAPGFRGPSTTTSACATSTVTCPSLVTTTAFDEAEGRP